MKLNYFIPALLVLFVFASCKDEIKKDTPETVEVTSGDDVTQTKVKSKTATTEAVSFNEPKMKKVFDNYIDLKDVLVTANARKASAVASDLMTAFANVGVNDKALMAAQKISESSDIEEQRTAFVTLTAEVESLLKDEIASGTIYKQYCPMAFDNTGASWLSRSSDIVNPYFGDKMLRCGRIEAKIE